MVQAAFYVYLCICDSDCFYISVYDYQIIAHVQESIRGYSGSYYYRRFV